MKNYYYLIGVIAVFVIGFAFLKVSNSDKNYIDSQGNVVKVDISTLPQKYTSEIYKYSINLPSDFTVEENFIYESTPVKVIPGIKFLPPKSLSEGTNLSSDTYLSIESYPSSEETCSAQLFLDSSELKGFSDFAGKTFTVAYSLGAGVGNIYEETVYATFHNNECLGVRYFIHHTVYENYPEGTVRKYDDVELKKLFDSIRGSLVLTN
jgi:hypothetical protein